jgi:undecaprenyl diphosphate synthase
MQNKNSKETAKKPKIADLAGLSHLAFIMDGNGRWANAKGKPREYGHRYGAKAFKRVLKYGEEIGLKTLTFYAFSTENWKRPKKEVDAIMRLLDDYLDEILKEADKAYARFVFIGNVDVLDRALVEKIRRIEQMSPNAEYTVNIAFNYGGRDEIVHACNTLIESGKKNISEDDISGALYTKASPDPDMIVRTGGDLRISNFLLWQAAYAELYFTDILWPDISERDIDLMVESFAKRKRRFGGLDKE